MLANIHAHCPLQIVLDSLGNYRELLQKIRKRHAAENRKRIMIGFGWRGAERKRRAPDWKATPGRRRGRGKGVRRGASRLRRPPPSLLRWTEARKRTPLGPQTREGFEGENPPWRHQYSVATGDGMIYASNWQLSRACRFIPLRASGWADPWDEWLL